MPELLARLLDRIRPKRTASLWARPPDLADLSARAADAGWIAQTNFHRGLDRLAATTEGQARLTTFLQVATPRQWISIDESIRREDYSARRKAPTLDVGEDLLSAGLASMDSNGYRREAAIRRLATFPDPLVGGFLALRTADWVAPVADLARASLADRIAGDVDTAVLALPIVLALDGRSRAMGMSHAILEAAAAEPRLRDQLLKSPDTTTRRCTLEVAIERGDLPIDDLVDVAVRDPDMAVATIAGRSAVTRAREGADRDVLDRLLRGRATVRRAVIEALQPDEVGVAHAELLLFDRSSPVRGAAQALLRRAGVDPAVAYRRAIDAGDHVPIAVFELGYVGGPFDAATIADSLGSTSIAARKGAVHGLTHLIGRDALPSVVPLLSDESPGVVRAAERRLRPFAGDIDRPILAGLRASSQPHVRRAALRLLRRRSLGERLSADFTGVADPDERIRRDADLDIRSWLQHGAASAPRADLATRVDLDRQLSSIGAHLEPGQVQAIRFHAGLRPVDLERGAN